MKYLFKSSIVEEDGQKVIPVPFNVWEVCDTKGTLTIHAKIKDDELYGDLLPKGNGIYNIPVNDEIAKKYGNETFEISFKIVNLVANMFGNSPYSSDNPIRKIDSMNLVTQPFDGLCGQTCIAMLAGVTLDEACEIMHCREWQANMGKIIETLDYLYIRHTNVIHYTKGEIVELPKCAIILEKMGRYSHYLICYDGVYYDPTNGILEDFDLKNMVGYLEVLTEN